MKKILLAATLSVMVMSSCKKEALTFELPTPPGIEEGKIATGVSLVNTKDKTLKLSILSEENKEVTLKLSIKAMDRDFKPTLVEQASVDKFIKAYEKGNRLRAMELLPEEFFTLSIPTIKAGETEKNIVFSLKNYENLPFGVYYAPIVLKTELDEVSYMVRVDKDGEYVKLTDEHKKPLPPEYKDQYTEPMKMIAYVETNDWDIRNMGQFILKNSKQPIFDMVVLFGPNMNYDSKAKKRYLFFNDKLQTIIKHPDIYIKPLRDRGIKVLIDILPNHQGVGYRNFQSYDEALVFAKELKVWADKLGIDGFDIDEEYMEYDKQPQLKTNYQSALWYARAIKEVMPDKLLTCYDHQNPFTRGVRDENGKEARDYIDFMVSDYNQTGPNNIKVDAKKYAAMSVEATKRGTWGAGSAAEYNLSSGHGGLMIFNIKGGEIRSGATTRDLSAVTRKFYGQDCIFSGAYHKGPNDL